VFRKGPERRRLRVFRACLRCFDLSAGDDRTLTKDSGVRANALVGPGALSVVLIEEQASTSPELTPPMGNVMALRSILIGCRNIGDEI
jgi:hypothetical protein